MKVYNKYFCSNKECPNYKKVGKGNILLHHECKEGKWKVLYCKTCGKSFSERQGTLFYRLHISEEKVNEIVKALVAGNGLRATARITGVNRDTVRRILKRIDQYCNGVAEQVIKRIPLNEAQIKEIWAVVKKKKRLPSD